MFSECIGGWWCSQYHVSQRSFNPIVVLSGMNNNIKFIKVFETNVDHEKNCSCHTPRFAACVGGGLKTILTLHVCYEFANLYHDPLFSNQTKWDTKHGTHPKHA